MFLLCFGLSITTYSQRATSSSRDATQVRLAATLAVTSSTLSSGTINTTSAVYTVVGTYSDPSGKFGGSSVTAGMMLIDGACKMYQITQFNSSNLGGTLNINVKPVGALSTEVTAPSTGLTGLVFDPTPNLLLPQWVFNMPVKVQSCLLSHMANILDLKLGNISPSILIKTTDYSLSNYDDTVLFDIAAASTLTLPSASANTAKVFKIGKIDESTNILTISPAIRLTASTSISTLNYPRTFIVQSDGTDWRVINQN
ncbi:hypothetical protein EMA8858_03810 [Emticicia aquatica]|uniref:CHRD domain-containing protein n=2 Tax=Emticicia aquatica TaxID=1681835 RepID=A0ABN8EY16_9BACT|nr:hypothetical protein EMA8858_03810 [Emticicia aquatica]